LSEIFIDYKRGHFLWAGGPSTGARCPAAGGRGSHSAGARHGVQAKAAQDVA